MARNDPQVNLRMPASLKDRLEAAATKNMRSLTAEIIARLEGSWDMEGYQDLADLFFETMRDNSHRLAREVEEYRQMAGTVRLLRHIIERMKAHLGDRVPEDISMLLGLLTKNAPSDVDPMAIIVELVESAEREDRLMAQEAADEEAGKRSAKIEQLLQRLNERVNS